ncbi:hypothetical protein P280DRAFT_469373 [Massarina eburnea CBS 473.64]|uniref:REJ domain-containing protein n=1 Tax=Massarina eburnea CBS 473.64 TaxID=1395130 RepID=A0A6A6S1U4_9PLEO|nr:hypothetical protein P280DRAFT_469373 [Massarina eburnea CBS 473.64]
MIMFGPTLASAFLLLASATAQSSTGSASAPTGIMSILPISTTLTPSVPVPSLTDSLIVTRPGPPSSSVPGSMSIPAGETPVSNTTVTSVTTAVTSPSGNSSSSLSVSATPTPTRSGSPSGSSSGSGSSTPSSSSAAVQVLQANGNHLFAAVVGGFAWALV